MAYTPSNPNGQATMANSSPVVIASDQSAIKSQIVDASGNVIDAVSGGGYDNLLVALGATNFIVSTVNSTSAQLNAGATFTGTVESVFNQQSYSILIVSDQNGTLTIKQYINSGGTQLVNSLSFTITANTPFSRSGVLNGNYVNITFQNTGASATTTLKIDTAYGTIPSATQLNNSPISIAEINGATAQTGSGTSAGALVTTNVTPLFRGRSGTFRTLGRAGTAGQKIAAIHNAAGSSVEVRVKRITVDKWCTVVKAVTVAPSIVRIWKFTAVPTNGTNMTKNKIGGSTTSNASVTLWNDSSADGTGSATTLTVTLPAGTIVDQLVCPRVITAVGEIDTNPMIFEYPDGIQLDALEGICVFLDYTAATQNPTTDMWVASIEWEEITV